MLDGSYMAVPRPSGNVHLPCLRQRRWTSPFGDLMWNAVIRVLIGDRNVRGRNDHRTSQFLDDRSRKISIWLRRLSKAENSYIRVHGA